MACITDPKMYKSEEMLIQADEYRAAESIMSVTTMIEQFASILQRVPSFPNYSNDSFGYPERQIRQAENSLVILGPPLHLYGFLPHKSCTVHVSGIPNWATMSDVLTTFEEFGKIFMIELSVKFSKTDYRSAPVSNGWAFVTFVSYDGAQKALFAHLTSKIPGMEKSSLSIYKGVVNNVVLLKNLPGKTPKSEILCRIDDYPGVMNVSIDIVKKVARMVFADRDFALLFMDIVSGGNLIIDNFTCTVEPEDKAQEEEDSAESD